MRSQDGDRDDRDEDRDDRDDDDRDDRDDRDDQDDDDRDDRDDRDDDDRDDDDRDDDDDDDRDDDDRDDDDDDDDDRDDDDDPHGGEGDDIEPRGDGHHGSFDDPLFYYENTPKIGSPDTPGRIRPDRAFEMKVYGRDLEMPDGEDVEFWGFEDDLNEVEEDVVRPSSPIRVTEGDIVHVTIKPAKRQHTIHMHGIEIDTHNDGVGHTSFEVTGSYTYQFSAGAPFRPLDSNEPKTRGAGTYIYHCHVNTTLHYQMGMWGPLIIDPIEGPGYAFHNGPQYDVDTERLWAAGDVDPAWRDLGHQAGLGGGDAGLNDFNPRYFDISGVFQPMRRRRLDPNAVIEDERVAAEVTIGGLPTLVRYVNAAYGRQRVIFDGIADGSLEVDVIAADGRGFDGLAPNFARPYRLTGPLETITAERYDLLVSATRPGTSVVTIETRHWITNALLGLCRTTVTAR